MFKILNRFRRDERGAAYIMTALSIVPLAGMTALAVDYVIADRNKTEIQTSVETVALYLAKRIALDPNLDASALIDEGKSILDATTDLDIGYDEFTVDPVTGKVRLAAFTMQDTYFMHMFGHEHLKVGAKAEARFGRTDIEVAIAMDVSGSMNTATTVSDGSGGTTSSTRIKDARTAAKKLVASASGNVADIENADIKFSIVPWHSTVVVGTEFENAWWVDWDGKSTGHYRYLPPFKKNAGNQTGDMYFNVPAAYQYSDSSSADEIVSWTPHMVDEVFPASVRNPEPMPGINTTALNNLPNIGVVTRREVFDMFSNVQWAGCFEHRHGDYMFSSAKPDSLIGDSLFIPYMAPDERGQSSQENWSTSNNGEPEYSKFTDTWMDDYRNNYLDDLGGSTDPDYDLLTMVDGSSYSSDEQEYYSRARVFNAAKYDFPANSKSISLSSYRKGPNGFCEGVKMLPLTDDLDDIYDKIDDMVAAGATDITTGLEWAWHALTPQLPFDEALPMGQSQKVLVLMTDGQNIPGFGGYSQEYMNSYTAFGYPKDDMLEHGIGLYGNDTDTIEMYDDGTKRFCDAIKAEGIKLYFVYFGTASVDSVDLVNHCASSAETAIVASNSDELIAAFEEIGENIGKLRLTHFEN
jgi:Flp pilus assembly protein TadG